MLVPIYIFYFITFLYYFYFYIIDNFDGFDTKVLEFKTVFCMKANAGRYRRISVVAVTGNKNGLAGFALGKAVDSKAALRRAKNRAGQKLMYIERYDSHTVYHDFFSQFCNTRIFVEKKPEGYGLKCHRAIRTICEMIGIKNLYAKVEGSTNLQNVVKAFFLGLLKQVSYLFVYKFNRIKYKLFKLKYLI